jgi:hypothetical protein
MKNRKKQQQHTLLGHRLCGGSAQQLLQVSQGKQGYKVAGQKARVP